MLYPPSKLYFIQLFSFSPSINSKEKQVMLQNYSWELKGINTSSLTANRLKDKVVLLNFWATWCPPCIAELPSIQKLYNSYKDQVKFVFISDENPEKIKQFFKKKSFDLPTYSIGANKPDMFKISSIPTTFIIDKNGKVRIHKIGAANWNAKKVRALLDELIAQIPKN